MKKVGIIFIIVSILLGISLFFFKENIFKSEKNNIENEILEDLDFEDDFEINKDEANSKIEEIRKKLKLRGMIADANMYFQENEYMNALIEYQKILKEIPNNEEINVKVGDIYYKINRFNKANEFYAKVKNSKLLDSDKAVLSLINEKGVTEENYEYLTKEIQSFELLSNEKKFYYINSISCILDYSLCRDRFQKFFEEFPNFETEELKIIYNGLENFKNFKSDDLYYKASFLTGAFYQNGFYYVALKTSESILEEKSDYQPIMRVGAKSSYELGDYISSKKYLNDIRKLDSSDPEISYFLGRVHEKLNDRSLALVNYRKALNDGYKDKADVKRRIIFIFFEGAEYEKMLKAFDDLMKEKNLLENDYNLAIYYNIFYNKFDTAQVYANIAIQNFPENEIFYSYLAWIMLQEKNISPEKMKIIEENIEKSLSLEKKTPITLLVNGIYNFKNKNYNKAIVNLKSALSLDKSGEYRETINYWLEEIQKEKNNNL